MNEPIEILQNRWLRWGTVNNHDGKPHFHRLPLLLGKHRISIYLHHFVGPDDARDPHDHPKWFLSIGLWGSYTETRYNSGIKAGVRKFTAPWIRWFPAEHAHQLSNCNAWTLVITGPVKRQWGFWAGPHQWVDKQEYVDQVNEGLNNG